MNSCHTPLLIMRTCVALCLCLLTCRGGGLVLPALSQTTFTLADLPASLGEFYRAYVRTNELDVSGFIGPKGGPRRWDFSAQRGADEEVRRIDIVSPQDGGHGSGFGAAGYAERTTRASDGLQSWSYYAALPEEGRAYFGFYDPISNPVDPATVFEAPTIDLPAHVVYGQTWRREVDFRDVLDLGFIQIDVLVHFTCDAAVDAYGSVVLPEIGEVPALRVNELHTYDTQDITLGLPIGQQSIRSYYWLVKNVGQAVQIISKPDPTAPPPESFRTAATFYRVFESSRLAAPHQPESVKNLRIAKKGAEVFLSWDAESPATQYQVEAADGLDATALWRVLTKTTDSFLFAPFDRALGTQFYRVLRAQ
jgi:hypothetical protein